MESYYNIHRAARLGEANTPLIFLLVESYNTHNSWYVLISHEDYIDTAFLPRLLCSFNQIKGQK